MAPKNLPFPLLVACLFFLFACERETPVYTPIQEPFEWESLPSRMPENSDEPRFGEVYDFVIDNEDDLWVNTSFLKDGEWASGAWELDGSQWAYFRDIEEEFGDQIKNTSISNLVFDQQNHIWFGFSQDLLYYNGTEFQAYALPSPVITDWRTKVFQMDEQGRIWLGAENYLASFSNNEWTVYPLPINHEFSFGDLLVTEDAIWLTTNTKLFQIRDGLVTQISEVTVELDGGSEEPFFIELPGDLARDQTGSIYIATANGLLQWQDDKWKLFNAANSPLEKDYIWDVTIDQANQVYVGTEKGVYLPQLDWKFIPSPSRCASCSTGIEELKVDRQNRKVALVDGYFYYLKEN